MNHYLSLSGTFRSYMEGKVTLQEMADGTLVIGPHKDGLHTADVVPSFILAYNTEKPKYVVEAEWLGKENVDEQVLLRWSEFHKIVLAMHKEGRVRYTPGTNYPAQAKELLSGNDAKVFFNGQWVVADELKYLD